MLVDWLFIVVCVLMNYDCGVCEVCKLVGCFDCLSWVVCEYCRGCYEFGWFMVFSVSLLDFDLLVKFSVWLLRRVWWLCIWLFSFELKV